MQEYCCPGQIYILEVNESHIANNEKSFDKRSSCEAEGVMATLKAYPIFPKNQYTSLGVRHISMKRQRGMICLLNLNNLTSCFFKVLFNIRILENCCKFGIRCEHANRDCLLCAAMKVLSQPNETIYGIQLAASGAIILMATSQDRWTWALTTKDM